jgi:hypothetical protein
MENVYEEIARLAKVPLERRGCDKCDTVTKSTMASPVQIILCPKCSVTPTEKAEITLRLIKEYKKKQASMKDFPVKKAMNVFGYDSDYYKRNFWR